MKQMSQGCHTQKLSVVLLQGSLIASFRFTMLAIKLHYMQFNPAEWVYTVYTPHMLCVVKNITLREIVTNLR